jgi:Flp pilus assembly protein TadB
MNEFDLDRLGDVWRQQPDPAEMERLQKSAAAIARRARITQVTDIVAAIAVAAVVIFLVANNPKPATVFVGGAAILVLLVSNIRLRRVRRIELGHLTGSTEEMLDQSIVRAEATLRHHRFGLIGSGPAFAFGIIVAAVTRGRDLLPLIKGALLVAVLGVAVVAGAFFYSLRGMRRARRELERLRAMREAYRSERESSGS